MLTTEEDIKNQETCRIIPETVDEKEVLDIKNLDGHDKRSAVAIFVLLAAIVVILLLPADENLVSANKRNKASGPQVSIVSGEYLNKVKIAKNLVTNNNLTQAENILKELIETTPYEGTPYMLMGDLYARKNMPIEAMYEYRKGVDLNPDFLDKKMTDVFQGKKVKNLVNEAKIAIDAGVENGSIDKKSVSKHKDTLYYMLRKIAGSCG